MSVHDAHKNDSGKENSSTVGDDGGSGGVEGVKGVNSAYNYDKGFNYVASNTIDMDHNDIDNGSPNFYWVSFPYLSHPSPCLCIWKKKLGIFYSLVISIMPKHQVKVSNKALDKLYVGLS